MSKYDWMKNEFDVNGFLTLTDSTIISSIELENIKQQFQDTFLSWEEGEVNPIINNSHQDARFGYDFYDRAVHYYGRSLNRRYLRATRGSPIKETDTNFLLGRRGVFPELEFNYVLIELIRSKQILDHVGVVLGVSSDELSFHNGSLVRVYPGCTGESHQYHIDTPGFIVNRAKLIDPSRFLVNVFIHINDVDSINAPMRVIPGSHSEYKKINALLAKSFKRSKEVNNLPQAGELWEELLPADLNPPHKIVGKSGTVTLMNSSLLHGATENFSADRVRDVVILNYSKRAHVEFHKRYFLTKKLKCIELYRKADRSPLFARTFGPQYKFFRINKTHLQILRTIRAFGISQIQPLKTVLRPAYRLLKNRKPPLIDLNSKKYLNIGCGANWTSLNTISLDFDPATCDVGLDLNTADRLPFPSSRFQGIYSSHCFEHLQEAKVNLWLNECYRVLEPGGIIRLSLPDIEKYFEAYEKRDAAFFDWIRGSAHYLEDSWLRLIVRAFAEPTVDKYDDVELYKMYQDMSIHEFLDFFKHQQEAITDQRLLLPHVHKSWWGSSKISSLLSDIGFSDIRSTSPMDSSCKEFTGILYKYKHPNMSFFIEAKKPHE